jgi:long-chain acyl-CoA synthetase
VAADSDFHALVGEAVARVNKDLSQAERVRRFILLGEPFSVENGMMTPSLKIRRHVIKQAFGKDLEALYAKTAKAS